MEQSFLGVTDDLEPPNVNLKYYDPDFECFSEWTADELKSFSEFTQKLKRLTWQQIYKSGGRLGDKTGLGYTPHKTKFWIPTIEVHRVRNWYRGILYDRSTSDRKH